MSTPGSPTSAFRSTNSKSKVRLRSTRPSIPTVPNHHPEHNISGDVLAILDADALKELGIATIGQRLAILKAVYNLKLAHNIPIEPGHYVPPCARSLLS